MSLDQRAAQPKKNELTDRLKTKKKLTRRAHTSESGEKSDVVHNSEQNDDGINAGIYQRLHNLVCAYCHKVAACTKCVVGAIKQVFVFSLNHILFY